MAKKKIKTGRKPVMPDGRNMVRAVFVASARLIEKLNAAAAAAGSGARGIYARDVIVAHCGMSASERARDLAIADAIDSPSQGADARRIDVRLPEQTIAAIGAAIEGTRRTQSDYIRSVLEAHMALAGKTRTEVKAVAAAVETIRRSTGG